MTDRDRETRLLELLDEAWRAFDEAHELHLAVEPAIPILFFGDSEAYFNSPLRIVTVGLNPSGVEFPPVNRFIRFPAALPLDSSFTTRANIRQVRAFNEYFRVSPYKSWFNSFEPMLNGLDCSYYDTHLNTAIHTDLASPVATEPTWSGLTKSNREALRATGTKLWHSLIRLLKPNIILISVAKEHLAAIDFPITPFETVITYDHTRPYHMSASRVEIDTVPACLIFGTASQKPFGQVSNEKKRALGAIVQEWIARQGFN